MNKRLSLKKVFCFTLVIAIFMSCSSSVFARTSGVYNTRRAESSPSGAVVKRSRSVQPSYIGARVRPWERGGTTEIEVEI